MGSLVPEGLTEKTCLIHNRAMMRVPKGSKTDFGGSILHYGRSGYYCPACNTFHPDKQEKRG